MEVFSVAISSQKEISENKSLFVLRWPMTISLPSVQYVHSHTYITHFNVFVYVMSASEMSSPFVFTYPITTHHSIVVV